MRRHNLKSRFFSARGSERKSAATLSIAWGVWVAALCSGGLGVWWSQDAWAQQGAAAPPAEANAEPQSDGEAETDGEASPEIPDPFEIPTPQGTPFETPMPSEDYYPCSDCHDGSDVNLQPRKLEDEHEAIVLEHAENRRWCLDCHSPDQRDKLRLASGALIPFEEAYRLCGQCHGSILSDWQAGIHGKRTGQWNGDKKFYLCGTCHDAHTPGFKPIKPEPAPRRAEEIK